MSSTANLSVNNNSGIDLIIAFVQGAAAGQSVDQLAWLNFSTNTPAWAVPPTPTSNSDLAPFMQEVANGDCVTIDIPSYAALVGFRCLVASTAYQNNAMQTLNISDGGKPPVITTINYMAFPDLMTAAYVFDKFEAGLTEGTPGIWNITSVDFLGIPMQLNKGSETVGYKNGVTSEGMFDLLAKLDAPYNSGGTITPNTATNIYRFFSPAHIVAADVCLDTQITKGLSDLNGNKTALVKYGGDTFSDFTASTTTPEKGQPVTGTVTCTSKLNGSVTVDNLTTVDAFAGTVGIKGTNNSIVVLGALLAAASCRGVLGNPEQWGDIKFPNTQCATPWNYYPTGVQSDEYSKVIHAYSIDGKNYGFSYDDYFADEAGFNVVTGDSVTLNVLAISGKMTAKANATPQPLTGCIAVTIPTGTTTNLGTMTCNGISLDAVTNKLCFLENQVVITFTGYPANLTNPEIHIDLTKLTQAEAISYWNNGAVDTGLSISGLVYFPNERQLTFSPVSKWIS